MTQTFVTTPLSTDELIRLKESLTPENRCELAYSGETVARLLVTIDQLQENLNAANEWISQIDPNYGGPA